MARKKLSDYEITQILDDGDFCNESDLDILSDDELENEHIINLSEMETIIKRMFASINVVK